MPADPDLAGRLGAGLLSSLPLLAAGAVALRGRLAGRWLAVAAAAAAGPLSVILAIAMDATAATASGLLRASGSLASPSGEATIAPMAGVAMVALAAYGVYVAALLRSAAR